MYKALFWKLWWSSRRKLFVILANILIPVLLCILLLIIKMKQPPKVDIMNTTYHSQETLESLMKTHYSFEISYFPSTDEVKRLMDDVKTILPAGSFKSFEPASTEKEMEENVAKKFMTDKFTAHLVGTGIIVQKLTAQTLEYTIRSTDYKLWNPNLFPSVLTAGPYQMNRKIYSNGFAAIQIAINLAYLKYIGIPPPNVVFKEFPYPPFKTNEEFQLIYLTFLPLVFGFGFLSLFLTVLNAVVQEKNSGAREMMKINGIRLHMIYEYWYMFCFIQFFITLIILIIMMSVEIEGDPVFPYSSSIILFIFFYIYCSSGVIFMFLIASIFNRSAYASATGLFVWLVLYYLFSSLIDKFVPIDLMFLTTFHPLGGLYKGIEMIASLESSTEGIHIYNLTYNIPNSSQIPVLFVMIGMLLGILLHILIFSYFDAVKPGKFGRAKPWNFIFPTFYSKYSVIWPTDRDNIDGKLIKSIKENADLPVGIEVINISKLFGSLIAVNNVSINFYKHQITVLLGHNGAGKTTLVSILTGIISPTNGDIYVDGSEIFSHLEKFRTDIGLCPQENLLMTDLTVYQHVVFFGMVKGMTKHESEHESDLLLNKFDLYHKKNNLCKKLSGGMKRKLCLSISLVKNPKVLFLDEPTTGLDPRSRRDIWDALLSLRSNRTILITTHFMEEADALGDRIAIMAHGEILCYGSSLFLKKKYGSGYHVIIIYKQGGKPKPIVQIIENDLPDSNIQVNEKQREIIFNVPIGETDNLPNLFHYLEQRAELKIQQINVICTSLEDVYLTVQKGVGITSAVSDVDLPKNDDNKLNSTGMKLILQQVFALYVKRIQLIKRNWIFFLINIIIFPILLTLGSIISTLFIVGKKPSEILLDLKMYGNTLVLIGGSSENNLVSILTKLIKSQGSKEKISGENTESELLSIGKKDEAFFRSGLIVAADFLNATPNMLYSSIAIHSLPIAINLFFNTYARSLKKSDINIITYNLPFNFKSQYCNTQNSEQLIAVSWISFLGIGTLLALTYFCILPISERITSVKHLQFMAGLRPILYWFSNFIIDFGLFCISLSIIMAMIFLLDSSGMYTGSIFNILVLVIELFAISSIFLMYFCSFIFKSYGITSLVVTFVSIILGIVAIIMNLLFSHLGAFFMYVWYVVPWIPFIIALKEILTVADFKYHCTLCHHGERKSDCDAQKASPEGLEGMKIDIKIELYALIAQAITFATLVLLLDYGFLTFLNSSIKKGIIGPIEHKSEEVDNDVWEEKLKVRKFGNLHCKCPHPKPLLIVDELGKKYKRNVTPVYDVTFTTDFGECFGLLGANGAGKTTTFSMLSGIIKQTSGDASINGNDICYSLSKSKFKFLKNIGYCPQDNILIEELSARQMLHLFARLKGVQELTVRQLSQKWINLFDLNSHSEMPSSTYSGGNKRKLCAAVAFIGDPPVLLFDEPTSAMDPVSRHKVWKILKNSTANNQTVLLSSHSMDECEAVCDRLTIMVKGYLQCIGSIPYLKQKFAQGYTVYIKLKPTDSEEQLNNLKQAMMNKFDRKAILKSEIKGFLHYHIENPEYKWSYLFDTMNGLKTKFKIIEDFMLKDTTLEEVFLSFAK